MSIESSLSDGRPGPWCLVVQGGGMRAIYSMAVLVSLEERGLRSIVSAGVGTSAGALNLAQFFGGRSREALDAYVHRLSDGTFIRPRRMWKMADMDYLIDDIVRGEVLSDDILRGSLTAIEHFIVGVMEASTGAMRYVDLCDPNLSDDPFEVLRATIAMPALYGRTVALSGSPYIDGAVGDPVPLARALSYLDVSKVAVITTRGLHDVSVGERGWSRLALRLWPGVPPAARHALLGRKPLGDAAVDLAASSELAGHASRSIVVCEPSDPHLLVGRLETDRSRLRDAADMGLEDGVDLASQIAALG